MIFDYEVKNNVALYTKLKREEYEDNNKIVDEEEKVTYE